jgi:hypothetical protein
MISMNLDGSEKIVKINSGGIPKYSEKSFPDWD